VNSRVVWIICFLVLSWLLFLAYSKRLRSQPVKHDYPKSRKWMIFFTIGEIYVGIAVLLGLLMGLMDLLNQNSLIIILIFSLIGLLNGSISLFQITTQYEEPLYDSKRGYYVGLVLISLATGIFGVCGLMGVLLLRWIGVPAVVVGLFFLTKSVKQLPKVAGKHDLTIDKECRQGRG